jgi:hypothetical protein
MGQKKLALVRKQCRYLSRTGSDMRKIQDAKASDATRTKEEKSKNTSQLNEARKNVTTVAACEENTCAAKGPKILGGGYLSVEDDPIKNNTKLGARTGEVNYLTRKRGGTHVHAHPLVCTSHPRSGTGDGYRHEEKDME